ncbi:LOW QUALITY PROTEIN: non-functional pseudokinase ZED1-like, partial [Eutrema salsugineum]|uniref:LOW QUALITY PROTEIN: non-functional pseudokinase ZED1-like n=1 Tax=Eutrema salsugineum TaxID=72664 RepID=UPI000CED089D
TREIANALAYLHTAFSRTLIHKDIQPCQIFLNENGTAKLGEFCNCVFIPQGETFVKDDVVEGTYGYLDPNYVSKGLVTEKTDVYSFGALMFLLLTGKIPQPFVWTGQDYLVEDPERLSKLVNDGKFDKVVDKYMLVVHEGRDIEQERLQVKAFLELSLRCIGRHGDVPKMIEVAKELKRIERSRNVSCLLYLAKETVLTFTY